MSVRAELGRCCSLQGSHSQEPPEIPALFKTLCLLYQRTAARAVTNSTMPYSSTSRKQSWGIKEHIPSRGGINQQEKLWHSTQLSLHWDFKRAGLSPTQGWGPGHIQRLSKAGQCQSHIILCIHRQVNTWWAALIFSSALGFHAALCKNCLFSLWLRWWLCPVQFRCFMCTAGAKRYLNFHYVQGIWPWFVLDDSSWHQMGQVEKCSTSMWKSLGYIQHQPWFPSCFTGTK